MLNLTVDKYFRKYMSQFITIIDMNTYALHEYQHFA